MGFSERSVVVAGHICLDLIPRFTHGDGALRPGALIEVGPAMTSTGGAVANTGLALHRLGVETSLLGRLGDDAFGVQVLEILNGYSASLTRSMKRTAGETTSYSVVISPPGIDRTFLHCPGANHTFGLEDVPVDALAGSSVLHFGYPPLMRSLQADGGATMCAIFERAHEAGLVTSLDMAAIDPDSETGRVDWSGWLRRVLPGVDCFLPSFDEVSVMLDGEVPALTVEALGSLGDRLLGMGAGVVVIKLGDQGLYLRTTGDAGRLGVMAEGLGLDVAVWRGREMLVPCFEAELVGTTGSGDCTIAGFLSALVRGVGPEEAVMSAVGVGAASVEAADAVGAVPSWSAVAQRIANGWGTLGTIQTEGWRSTGSTVVLSERDGGG